MVLIAAALAFMLDVDTNGLEIVTRLQTSYLDYFLVAFAAGLAGTFSFYWPNMLETIPGIAISVAIIPPVAIVGIALSNFNWSMFETSLVILAANVVGIFIGAFITLALLRLYVKRNT